MGNKESYNGDDDYSSSGNTNPTVNSNNNSNNLIVDNDIVYNNSNKPLSPRFFKRKSNKEDIPAITSSVIIEKDITDDLEIKTDKDTFVLQDQETNNESDEESMEFQEDKKSKNNLVKKMKLKKPNLSEFNYASDPNIKVYSNKKIDFKLSPSQSPRKKALRESDSNIPPSPKGKLAHSKSSPRIPSLSRSYEKEGHNDFILPSITNPELLKSEKEEKTKKFTFSPRLKSSKQQKPNNIEPSNITVDIIVEGGEIVENQLSEIYQLNINENISTSKRKKRASRLSAMFVKKDFEKIERIDDEKIEEEDRILEAKKKKLSLNWIKSRNSTNTTDDELNG